MPDLTTTIKHLKTFSPCKESYKKFIAAKGSEDATEVKLSEVLDICGIEDACWFLRCFNYKEYCLFLADVAESVLPIFEKYSDDPAPRKAIEAVRLYHSGAIQTQDLQKATDAAAHAAHAAADAAYAAHAAQWKAIKTLLTEFIKS